MYVQWRSSSPLCTIQSNAKLFFSVKSWRFLHYVRKKFVPSNRPRIDSKFFFFLTQRAIRSIILTFIREVVVVSKRPIYSKKTQFLKCRNTFFSRYDVFLKKRRRKKCTHVFTGCESMRTFPIKYLANRVCCIKLL